MHATNVIRGFLTGLPALMAVGPIALLLVEQGLNRGLRAASPAAVGVAAGDTAFAVVAAMAGTAASAALVGFTTWLKVAAALMILAIAGRLAMVARRSAPDPNGAGAGPVGGLATLAGPRLAGGFLGLTVVNPLTIVVYAGIVVSGGTGVGTAGWVLGMGLASLAVHGGYVGLGHVLGSTLSAGAVVWLRLAAAAMLVGLAAHMLLG